MNKKVDQFTFEASSDLDYEKMVINLNFGNNQIAVLNCENGIDQAEINVLDRFEDKIIWTFDLKNFIVALNIALEKLRQSNE